VDEVDPMFEPDMKPTERKLIVLLFILVLGSLAYITYHNLQMRSRRGELAPSFGKGIATLAPAFSRSLQ
jgi:hypothetical protein